METVGETSVIIVKNLTKKYGRNTVLDIKDLQIKRGEFLAITGASGSGKSTLLNILSGLDRSTSGEVLVDGQNISRLRDGKISKFRNKKIGFIFQFFYLQPFLTVRQNIEVAALPRRIKSKIRSPRAEKLASVVGLSDRANAYPRELSGGQIQRVAIARSLINSPEILFADEPTGNLDSKNSSQIIDLLQKIQKQTGMTLIVVTHDERVAQKADRIIEIEDGKVKNVEN
ncbi:MAG: ABC transporter ATP-binding protein [bacterium]|nr:ABC transporter ATP-binding protein [bacterium]